MRLYRFVIVLVLGTIALASFGAASAQGNASPVEQACIVVQPTGWVEYGVVSGDTLSDIAANTGSTVDELARVNCIVDARRIVAGQRVFVPHLPDPIHHFLRRCLNAGFTTQECRRIYNALYGSDQENFLRRCLNAGYTEQQCRRIYNALFEDDNNIAERCRLAGLTPEQCRRIVNAGGDSGGETPQADPVRPVDENTSEENTQRGTRP